MRVLIGVLTAAILPGVLSAQHSRIAGRVLDSERNPAVGATVHLTSLAHPELPPGLVWALEDEIVSLDVVTDTRGVFRVDSPQCVGCEVFAEDGKGGYSRRIFPVVAGDFVELTLGRAHQFAGVVTDVKGNPVADAVVAEGVHLGEQYSRTQYGRARRPITTLTDRDGRFVLPALDGSLTGRAAGARTLVATHEGLQSSANFYRVDGQDLLDLDLRLNAPETTRATSLAEEGRPESASIAFRLRAVRTDKPLARARVVIAVGAPGANQHVWTESTDDDGNLAILAGQPGQPTEAWIEIDGRFVPLGDVLQSGAQSEVGEVNVASCRSLSGTLRAQDGSPLASAQIQYVGESSEHMRVAYADRTGRYRLEQLRSGPGTLVVNAGFLGASLAAIDATQTRCDVRLTEGSTVTGRVSLVGGTPAAGASMQVIVRATPPRPGRALPLLYLYGRADEDGGFIVRGLPAGDVVTIWGMTTHGTEAWMGNEAGVNIGPGGVSVLLQPHDGSYR